MQEELETFGRLQEMKHESLTGYLFKQIKVTLLNLILVNMVELITYQLVLKSNRVRL